MWLTAFDELYVSVAVVQKLHVVVGRRVGMLLLLHKRKQSKDSHKTQPLTFLLAQRVAKHCCFHVCLKHKVAQEAHSSPDLYSNVAASTAHVRGRPDDVEIGERWAICDQLGRFGDTKEMHSTRGERWTGKELAANYVESQDLRHFHTTAHAACIWGY